MKLHKSLLLFGASILLLTACGDSEEGPKETSAEDADTEIVEDAEVEEEENTELVGSTYEGANGIYEFTEVEQMESAITDDQIIAITMNYTNTTDEAQDPWFAIAFDLDVTQETDDTVETLDGANGLYPDNYKPEAVEMGSSDIKPDSTVEVVVGYTLHTPGNPVHFEPFMGEGDFNKILETNPAE